VKEEEGSGQRISSYRKIRGYSLSELARRSGVSRSYLYLIESGGSIPTEEKLRALAKALDVSMLDILGTEDARMREAEELLREWKKLACKVVPIDGISAYHFIKLDERIEAFWGKKEGKNDG